MSHAHPPRHAVRQRSLGFSLLEVLVTLLIVSLGLLGMSKMQAAALSNTQIARTRSLIALQAASLAAAMHANPDYWADNSSTSKVPASVSASGTTVTGVSATGDCAAGTCTPEQMGAYDLRTWASNMNDRFPSYAATITCSHTAISTPVSCIIKLSWSEKYIAINQSTASAAAGNNALTSQQFSLFVEP